MILLTLQKILNFIIKKQKMENPIAKKKHQYPKDFNITNTTKDKKVVKQYTFNKQPTITDSINDFDQYQRTPFQYSKQANPEEEHHYKVLKRSIKNTKNSLKNEAEDDKKQPLKRPSSNRQIDSQYEEQLQKKQINHEKIKQQIQNDILSRDKWELQVEQEEKKPEPQILPLLTPRKDTLQNNSGLIRKQKIAKNKPLFMRKSQQFVEMNIKHQLSPQRTFNKLALSLMGIKRSKANYSCQGRTTFLENSRKKSRTRYGISTKKQTQIYEHSVLPFRASSIQNLKAEINQVAQKRPVNKTPAEQKNQTNSSLLQTEQDESYYPQLCVMSTKPIKINHKTSLASLKSLMIQTIDPEKIAIEVPNFFIAPPNEFLKQTSFDSQKLNHQAGYTLSHLGIPIMGLTVRRYSNCLVIINGNICIVWHDGADGKKYFGGWKTRYFDEGMKQGVGLEWNPRKSVYYGQFYENKKHGFGVMKKRDGSVVVGFWKKGKPVSYGIQRNH